MDSYNLGCCRVVVVCLAYESLYIHTHRHAAPAAVRSRTSLVAVRLQPGRRCFRVAPLLSVIKRSVFFGFGAPNSPTTDMQVTSLEKQMTDLHKILV